MSIGSAARRKNASRQSMPLDVSIMEIHNDFKELLELFSFRIPQDNKRKVEYLVVTKPGCHHRAVGKMRIVNISIPAFDPEDEWFD